LPRPCNREDANTPYTFVLQKSAKIFGATILVLLFVTIVIWWAVASASGGELRVTFLDIGQGDAIFIESPSGVQMLIDGGKNREVIRKLSREMPLFDRSIDVVLATHPDADHIGGLPDVLKRYRAALIVQSSVQDAEGVDAAAFAKATVIETEDGAQLMTAERGQVIDLGDGAYFEILFPDRDVAVIETNTGSIIGRLVYGDTSFMLTGDAPDSIEKYLVQLNGLDLKSSVLKAGHHGSRTSSSLMFVGFVSPEYAIFSRGCDNSYGHPHEEPIAVFAQLGVETFDTCEDGSVTFVSDGKIVRKE
jgi:competence protein ComEC